MGRGKFDKKTAVRFTLLPGPDKEGKPSVLYKPVESRKTRLSKRQRKEIITELAGVEQVTINGKKVRDDEIPACVLEQIRGRGDIVFNQIHGEEKEEEVGDLYEIQDGREDDEYEEYPDYQDELQMEKVEEGHEEDYEDEEGDWQDEDEESYEQIQQQIEEKPAAKPYSLNEEDFPIIQQPQKVEIDGVTYMLTKAQAKLLETVIPQNYQELDFGGLSFKKYNEDGLPISDKAKYEKYFLKEDEKVVIIDSYEHVPTKPLDSVDNDFKPSQINGNKNVKQIQEALEYEGEQQVYEQLQDDFFAKMIQAELEQNSKEKEKAKPSKQPVKSVKPQQKQKQNEVKPQKKAQKAPKVEQQTEQQLEAQLDKALFNFQHNIQQRNAEENDEDNDQQQDEQVSHGNYSMNFTDIQKRQEYIGRDGELDWRCLTKKQKKQYMKTKVIRQFYDELREREIEDKLKGKVNVKPQELHLKDRIKHITYQEDHVMRNALQEDLKEKVDLQASESSSSFSSDEDDIISFHQKTSIIASNLSIIEQPRKPKAPKQKEQQPSVDQLMQQRIKVVPQQRKKDETKEERKQRKERLKAQKKEKKEQKKDFAEKFSKIKKETMRQENRTNPLNKVSYVKIY